jgi:hypothetical protein
MSTQLKEDRIRGRAKMCSGITVSVCALAAVWVIYHLLWAMW